MGLQAYLLITQGSATSIETTLRKVDNDIAEGDLGKARDRLHGLLRTYPDNLELRHKLGEIYWKLQYPAMAGRYWYLEEPTSPEMQKAQEGFERSCGNNPLCMLDAIKFRGNLEALNNTYASRTLKSLTKQVEDKYGFKYHFGKANSEEYKLPWYGKLVLPGCALVLIILAGLAVIGFMTVI